MLERKTFSKIGFSLVTAIVAVNVISIIVVVILLFVNIAAQIGGSLDIADITDLVVEQISSDWASVVLLAVSDFFIILIVWLFVKKLPKAPIQPSELGFGGKLSMVFAVFCVCMSFLHILAEVGWFVNYVFQSLLPIPIYESTTPIESATNYSGLIANFVMVCIIAPIAEEIIFRKLVISPLRAFGDTVAILFSGIAFGLFHLNFEQMFYAAAIGILLGYAYIKTNSLWVPILIHCMINFVGGIVPSLLDMWLPAKSSLILCGMIIAFWIIGGCLIISLRKKISLEPAPFRFSVTINAKLVIGNAGTILFTILCFGFSLYMALSPGLMQMQI